MLPKVSKGQTFTYGVQKFDLGYLGERGKAREND